MDANAEKSWQSIQSEIQLSSDPDGFVCNVSQMGWGVALAAVKRCAEDADAKSAASAAHHDKVLAVGRGAALDLGCGLGHVATVLGLLGFKQVWASDISPKSFKLTRETWAKNAATPLGANMNASSLHLRKADVFDIKASFEEKEEEEREEKGKCDDQQVIVDGFPIFDLIVANPPALPQVVEPPPPVADSKKEGAPGNSTPPWNYTGGSTGRELLERIIKESGDHLRPHGGTLITVGRSDTDWPATRAILDEAWPSKGGHCGWRVVHEEDKPLNEKQLAEPLLSHYKMLNVEAERDHPGDEAHQRIFRDAKGRWCLRMYFVECTRI